MVVTKVTIKLPVVFTVAGSKLKSKEARDAAYNPTVAAESIADVSVPIIPENGLVNRAGVGFNTFPILRIISEI